MCYVKNCICAKTSLLRVDDLAVDLYYYVDKFYYNDIFVKFCDFENKKMLTYVTATWLSLGIDINPEADLGLLQHPRWSAL